MYNQGSLVFSVDNHQLGKKPGGSGANSKLDKYGSFVCAIGVRNME
jgi:hypothetical protein